MHQYSKAVLSLACYIPTLKDSDLGRNTGIQSAREARERERAETGESEREQVIECTTERESRRGGRERECVGEQGGVEEKAPL